MQKLKKFCSIVLLTIGLIICGTSVLASAATPGNDVGFSVKALLPKNQIEKKDSFFNLRMKSQQDERLQVRVYNTTNQDIKVKNAIHTAWTSSAGAIEYVKTTKDFDTSLRYKMSDISKLQGKQIITIPAGGSKLVTAKVKIPRTEFQGTILGGWYFKRADSKVISNVKGASNMHNQYSYVIGMMYTMGKNPSPVMRLGTVQAGLANYHRGVIANLRNTTAVIIPNLKMNTTITNRDGGSVVKHLKQDNVQMAPNTTFKYGMLYGDQQLKAGHYHLHMVVKNRVNEWVFDRNFTITQAQANKYNKAAVESSGLSFWLILALGALAMLILILLILLIIYLIRRKKKQDEADTERSK
ncbi:DUF916 and DUF3324 domain-containing protein [Levilactobacillus angrenensis]|uniref:DUF916 and DUF3324 domain-containing protein n=1 Tax=Levilactobacillus angrenensis TaxID=2486020 RepID=A0ABW1UCW9_9LACO|nr:DUF916 and DUF3324 domain-containing protein [Levilactobacillus angrenensis]